jgi:hypothetical protein
MDEAAGAIRRRQAYRASRTMLPQDEFRAISRGSPRGLPRFAWLSLHCRRPSRVAPSIGLFFAALGPPAFMAVGMRQPVIVIRRWWGHEGRVRLPQPLTPGKRGLLALVSYRNTLLGLPVTPFARSSQRAKVRSEEPRQERRLWRPRRGCRGSIMAPGQKNRGPKSSPLLFSNDLTRTRSTLIPFNPNRSGRHRLMLIISFAATAITFAGAGM